MNTSSYGMNFQRGRTLIQEPITVNCRYDRDEIENRLRIGALTKNGTSTMNFKVHDSPPTQNRELIEIQKNELVFITKNRSRVSANNGIGASSIPVLSTLNGCYKKLTNEEKQMDIKKESILEENIDVIGISLVDANNHTTKGNRPISTTAVQIAGLNSIPNTSDKRILAGELITWEIPTSSEVARRKGRLGMHPDKVILKTVPYKLSQESFLSIINQLNERSWVDIQNDKKIPVHMMRFLNNLKQFVEEIPGVGEDAWDTILAGDKAKKSFIYNLAKTFMELQESFDRRIIGRATSNAMPGEDFDIYLNR